MVYNNAVANAKDLIVLGAEPYFAERLSEAEMAVERKKARKMGREEGRAEGREEGRAEGRTESNTEGYKNSLIEVASKMIENNYIIDDIIKVTGLSKNEVEELYKNITVQ